MSIIKNKVTELDLNIPLIQEFSQKNITVIIPAAGKGTRLGYHKPKLLFSILDKEIILWIHEALKDLYAQINLVVSNDSFKQINEFINENKIEKIKLFVQDKPTGMKDAIEIGLKEITTKYVLIIWGDQVCVSRITLLNCIYHAYHDSNHSLIFPTVFKKSPYIQFIRNSKNQIQQVLESREINISYEDQLGETDCGVFLFNTATLKKVIYNSDNDLLAKGKTTGEQNLLPLIPLFDDGAGTLLTVRSNCLEESIGINSIQDVNLAEVFIASLKL